MSSWSDSAQSTHLHLTKVHCSLLFFTRQLFKPAPGSRWLSYALLGSALEGCCSHQIHTAGISLCGLPFVEDTLVLSLVQLPSFSSCSDNAQSKHLHLTYMPSQLYITQDTKYVYFVIHGNVACVRVSTRGISLCGLHTGGWVGSAWLQKASYASVILPTSLGRWFQEPVFPTEPNKVPAKEDHAKSLSSVYTAIHGYYPPPLNQYGYTHGLVAQC